MQAWGKKTKVHLKQLTIYLLYQATIAYLLQLCFVCNYVQDNICMKIPLSRAGGAWTARVEGAC